MRRVMVFDHEDSIVGELSPDEVLSLVRTEVVNGEHTLTIRTTRVLEIGWRILTKDGMGKWREHVVYGADAMHASGEAAIGEYYCVWSLMHDLAGTTVSAMPGVQIPVYASVALDAVLGGTSRWVKGDVENTAQGGASMYDMSGWDAMSVLIENWGGEIDAAIEVGPSGVTARKVDYYEMQGSSEALRRYDFGADMKSVRRRIEDCALYCRISPRGKGEQTEGGGYGRKITIASVNGGKDYLEYAPMVSAARLPDGSGGWEYPTLIVENSSCETPSALKAWGQSVLEAYCTPKVTYTVDVVQASAEGVDMHGVALGDVVHLVDRRFGDGLRLSGRVSSMTVDMLDERNVKVTIGSVSEWLSEALAAFGARFDAVSARVGAIAATQDHMATSQYVGELMDRINAELNAFSGYTYITDGEGFWSYTCAVTDPTVGAEAKAVIQGGGSAAVVNIQGGGIRIANSLTAQGDWDWKTVFVSGHILADLVTAAKITAGFIGNASGNCEIDLDNNVIRLGYANSRHMVVDNGGVDVYTDASNVAAHFGYGNGVNEQGGYTQAPYFTLGRRKSGSIIGNGSMVLGKDCEASAYYSYAEGTATKATAAFAHAEGNTTEATGKDSHAEGTTSKAKGSSSHAEGSRCQAEGFASHAEGRFTLAKGDGSHASGEFTEAKYENQFVCGRLNANQSDSAFEIGNNVQNDLLSDRRNAFRVTWAGAVYASSFNPSSDRRIKTGIEQLEPREAFAFIRALVPRIYKKNGVDELGFVAQEVEKTTLGKMLVGFETNYGYDDFRTLNYNGIIAPLVAYCQHLEKRIEQLEARLESVTDDGQ